MYETIIIIIIIVVRRLLLLGYQLPRYFTSVPHFTHTCKWGIKYTSAVRAPSLLRHFSSSRGLADSRVRVQAIFWDRASQVGGSAHVLSSSVRTLQRLWIWILSGFFILWMLRGRGCARDGTERGKWSIPGTIGFLLLIWNVLKTDSKTKPTSKLNCRVIIFIYKLGYVKSAKRDIF